VIHAFLCITIVVRDKQKGKGDTMRTVSINVLKYEELSDRAKEKALQNYQSEGDYPWSSENENTLKAFQKIFPIMVKNWEYGYRNDVNFTFNGDDDIEEMRGIRLATYIYNNYYRELFTGKYYSLWSKKEKSPTNPSVGKLKKRYSKVIMENCCVLTGFCHDDDILEPVYKFLKKPCKNTNFKDLMEDCLEQWVSACGKDHDHYFSEEAFAETCESNEWEFHEDGTMF
jgi:hypothetical protein